MNRVKISRKQAERILRISFPQYRGRKIAVEFSETVTFSDTNSSGGTLNKYVAVRSDFSARRIPAPAPWVNPYEGHTVALTDDLLIVEHTFFCGQDCGITIHAHPSLAPKVLPA